MKVCRGPCGREKIDDAFAWRSRSLGTRQYVCRECKKTYNQGWYRNHKPEHLIRVRVNGKDAKAKIRAAVEALKSKPCKDCGVSYPPYVMDFDHLDPKEKSADVGRMVSSRASLATILEEVKKCDLVCSNCHRERTHQRRPRSSIG